MSEQHSDFESPLSSELTEHRKALFSLSEEIRKHLTPEILSKLSQLSFRDIAYVVFNLIQSSGEASEGDEDLEEEEDSFRIYDELMLELPSESVNSNNREVIPVSSQEVQKIIQNSLDILLHTFQGLTYFKPLGGEAFRSYIDEKLTTNWDPVLGSLTSYISSLGAGGSALSKVSFERALNESNEEVRKEKFYLIKDILQAILETRLNESDDTLAMRGSGYGLFYIYVRSRVLAEVNGRKVGNTLPTNLFLTFRTSEEMEEVYKLLVDNGMLQKSVIRDLAEYFFVDDRESEIVSSGFRKDRVDTNATQASEFIRDFSQ